MNEGFTTFLERRIAAKVFNEKERHLQASGQTQAYVYMYTRGGYIPGGGGGGVVKNRMHVKTLTLFVL